MELLLENLPYLMIIAVLIFLGVKITTKILKFVIFCTVVCVLIYYLISIGALNSIV